LKALKHYTDSLEAVVPVRSPLCIRPSITSISRGNYRRVAVYLETYCNIGSKKRLPTAY